MRPSPVSPSLTSRGEGANKLCRLATHVVYPYDAAGATVPPARSCTTIATSCGLATTTAVTAATATTLSRVKISDLARAASHGISASTATITAITTDSWLTSAEAPSTTPRINPRPIVGPRRSRTAASRVIGRNTVPYTMLMWYQAWYVSIPDSPKNAPAAIAPVLVDSHSRAGRYIA